jgi:cytochrome c553
MKEYSTKISLIKNGRGIYYVDTSIGCASGMGVSNGGCYNDCYAAKSAKQYGYDFSKTVLRYFENRQHQREVISQINRIKLDFVRIGCSGDPSENWDHTFEILKVISKCNKEIVIVTKHWTKLTDGQLQFLNTINVCINTSVSALDKPDQLSENLNQYNRIKPYCKSVLRIVSCDFNLKNETGNRLAEIQRQLFKNEDTIDTVFRPSKKNPLVADRIINVKTGNFNGHKALISKFNKKTFMGKCANCHEMCGAKMNNPNHSYPNKRFLPKQLALFKLKPF